MTLTPQETVERMARADEQSKALKAWTGAGGDLAEPRTDRPETPDLDAINAEYEAKKAAKEEQVSKQKETKPKATKATRNPKAAPAKATAPAPAEPKAVKAEGARLSPGALRPLVTDYLQRRARQTEGFSPSAIGKAIDRSSGAVANVLAKMVADGSARQVSAKPKRYAIVAKSDRKAS